MKDEMYCGSSCVKYIFEKFKNNGFQIRKDLFWTTEIALYLKQNLKRDVEVYYYKSKLIKDYFKKNNSDFLGFKYITEFIKNDGIIFYKKMNINNLKSEIRNSEYIILCVESKLFNNDSSMNGGHYIILSDVVDDMVKIVNPLKNGYEIKDVNIKKIISFSKHFGSWRIVIKK